MSQKLFEVSLATQALAEKMQTLDAETNECSYKGSSCWPCRHRSDQYNDLKARHAELTSKTNKQIIEELDDQCRGYVQKGILRDYLIFQEADGSVRLHLDLVFATRKEEPGFITIGDL